MCLFYVFVLMHVLAILTGAPDLLQEVYGLGAARWILEPPGTPAVVQVIMC